MPIVGTLKLHTSQTIQKNLKSNTFSSGYQTRISNKKNSIRKPQEINVVKGLKFILESDRFLFTRNSNAWSATGLLVSLLKLPNKSLYVKLSLTRSNSVKQSLIKVPNSRLINELFLCQIIFVEPPHVTAAGTALIFSDDQMVLVSNSATKIHLYCFGCVPYIPQFFSPFKNVKCANTGSVLQMTFR